MIKPNWNNFKSKFNENPQANFEWLCYLLFCQEFKIPEGIFRYKNQSGIETNPITKESRVIGWQAKFYDTKLSENKADLIEMIEKSKNAYPELTEIIFYTNQEWGQKKSSKKINNKIEVDSKLKVLEKSNDPKIKHDIDQKAKELNILIEWRVASFFESPLVVLENENISKHFFVFDKSIFDLIEAKQKHTENLLHEIKTDIDFKDKKIEIDRSHLIDCLRENLIEKQILVLSGEGGVGKTAIIKKFFESEKYNIPFYVFKANEFERDNINELFGEYSLEDFSNSHQEELRKVIVVDSAEKLLELTNIDPFKSFLTVLIKDKWQIIFTTRNNYLTELNYDLIDIYNLNPGNLTINNLEYEELNAIAENNSIYLPEDGRLLELIKNPFYLSEYLRFYTSKNIDYVKFKEKLWSKIIVKNKPAREQCFLATAFQRASEGHFFVTPTNGQQILNSLVKDGILGYEVAGYFITHDIYEEWALEKKVSVDYIRKTNNKAFFENIGESLPVRRAFRAWISERLLLNDDSIKRFSTEIVQSEDISIFWKDELWIAVLLSDGSATFFNFFKKDLLSNDQKLLKRLTFLLRLACKNIDYNLLKNLGISDSNLLSIKHVLTKPRGTGWQSTIRFIYDNIYEIGIKNIYFILPVIHEWNQTSKTGETTRFSSLIALKYYQWSIDQDIHLSREKDKKNLLQTILHGAAMIKPELEIIFEKVVKNKWSNHQAPYYDLIKIILTDTDAVIVWMNLPNFVLQLANLFWYRPVQENTNLYSRMDIDDEFGLSETLHSYFPESPYQTPIYWLLQSEFKKTINFILNFTNKTTEYFSHSHLSKNEIEQVDVFIKQGDFTQQFICDRLWCSYRGTQVSPNLLSSIHMALEKFFLEKAKYIDSTSLEGWLIYMLKNSKSASISAVVASIVLANPDKTFNVAVVLFHTKEFFYFDLKRLILDQSQKGSLISLKNSFGSLNARNTLHELDRINACDDPHRINSLEHLALNYQVFKSIGISENDFKQRQKTLWDIFDKYYSQIPNRSNETEIDKHWRLCLARMDRRKMKITTENKKEGLEISFIPEIDSKLREYSEEAINIKSEYLKYSSLSLWLNYKKEKDERHKLFGRYEGKPNIVLQECKEILEKLHNGTDENFRLFNGSIPIDACSILLIEYFNLLTIEDKEYCKDIILEYSKVPLMPRYQYKISDGTASAISALPVLFHNYPLDRDIVKLILLMMLFNDYPIGIAGGHYSFFPTMSINKLWADYFDDMQSLLVGYLILKPKYEKIREDIRLQNYKRGIYDTGEGELNEIFLNTHEHELQQIFENKISLNNLNDIKLVDLHVLNTAFQLIPLGTSNIFQKQLAFSIINIFSTKLLSLKRQDKVDYSIRHLFMERLSYLTLKANVEDIAYYLKPFVDEFNCSETISELFEQFIICEDKLNTYDKFWYVWNLFFDKVATLCRDEDRHWYISKIIKSYLFAQTPWSKLTNGWRTFKDSNSQFFAEVSKEMGHCPSTLYSLAKSLDNVANLYLNLGIAWLSEMLTSNRNLWVAKLEGDTIYHLENLIRRYIYKDREKIRRTKQLKEEVLVILEFLVEKGSVIGYMSRENIL